jgi:hypothetical protein
MARRGQIHIRRVKNLPYILVRYAPLPLTVAGVTKLRERYSLVSHGNPRNVIILYRQAGVKRVIDFFGKRPRHRTPLVRIAAAGVVPWRNLKQVVRELERRAVP